MEPYVAHVYRCLYYAQMSKLYFAQMSILCADVYIMRRCISCILRRCLYYAQVSILCADVYIMRRCLYYAQMSRLYRALVPNPSAQMSILRRYRSILCPDVYAFITRRFLNIYPRRCLGLYYTNMSMPVLSAGF